MNRETIDTRLRALVERLPTGPGVYMFKDGKGQIMYVGKAKELRTRVRSYLREGADGRYHIQFLLRRIEDLDFMVTETEQEALILENNLIKKHRPRYNIFLKDDKTYVNVRLSIDHPWPRLTVVRRPRKDGARYFGPFASAGATRSTLRMLGRIFPMRTCSDSELESRQRPCLYYYIKRCPAPCVGLADAQVYRETVDKVTMFLKGRSAELVKTLQDKMTLQSAERRYEEAARTRDQLFAIERTQERQRITSTREAERDVFGVARAKDRMAIQCLQVRDGKVTGGDSYYFDNASLPTGEHLSSFLNQYYQAGASIPSEVVVSDDVADVAALEEYLSSRRERRARIVRPQRGERRHLVAMAVKNARAALEEHDARGRNKELLEELEDLLGLRSYPRRIECFDVSNFHGKEAVASRVTFIDGEPAKTLYRHYRVRTIEGANDYGMMDEVLTRRFARGVKEGDLPDLLLVDGGRGQLNVALAVLARLGLDELDVLGIAKVRDERGKRKVRGKERIYSPHLAEPLLLEGNSESLYLLERVRDEAHRFAITHHKRVRSKSFEVSALDAVPGVGPVLKRRLLAAFGSIDRIREASPAQLATIQGVSPALAAKLKEFLGSRS